MKNEKIIDSWNLINPDSESKDRMLDEILNQNGKLISRNSNRMKKFIPAVICLAVFLSGTIVYAMVTSGGILKLFTKIFLQVACVILILSSAVFFLYFISLEESEYSVYQ